MKEFTMTDRTGNTFRTVTFQSDNGEVAFIERNQKHTPDEWFLLAGILLPKEKAIEKIRFYCR